MISYLIIPFILCQFAAWCIYRYTGYLQSRLEQTFSAITWPVYLRSLIVLSVVCPLIEEAVYRCAAPSMFGGFEHHKIIISVVFALTHSYNYTLYKSWMLTGIQVFYTFFLGYYLSGIESIWQQIGTHALMNFLAVNIELTMQRYVCPQLFDAEYCSKRWFIAKEFYCKHNKFGNFVKSSSCSNLADVTKQNTEYEKQQQNIKWHTLSELTYTDTNSSIKLFHKKMNDRQH